MAVRRAIIGRAVARQTGRNGRAISQATNIILAQGGCVFIQKKIDRYCAAYREVKRLIDAPGYNAACVELRAAAQDLCAAQGEENRRLGWVEYYDRHPELKRPEKYRR